MQPSFDTALKYVLIDEGGNSDDPQDHGGRTSRGITQREYNSWCRLNNKPQGDVWYASDDDVRAIYHDQYWKPYCDDLPSGVDYLFFDISVNAGRTQAVRQFQRALGVNVDGMFGQITLEAIKNHPDAPSLIKDVSEVRRNWYKSLSQFPRYGRGWLSRVDHCEQGALAMVNSLPWTKPSAPAMPKASQDKPVSSTVSPETSGSATLGTGTIGTMLNQLSQMIEPYKDAIKWASYILLGLALTGACYTLWTMYKRNKIQAIQ